MAYQSDLQKWILNALNELGGSARIPDICRYIWEYHHDDLKSYGERYFTWQYDMRWAGQSLLNEGKISKKDKGRGIWSLISG